ncbi:MAG: hypothetical protein K6F05_02225 [Succinivibrio sp.]|nr:hypothetical protein [Succinivibrio sp.]
MVYNYGRLVISTIRIRLARSQLTHGREEGYSLLNRSGFFLLTGNINLSDCRQIPCC